MLENIFVLEKNFCARNNFYEFLAGHQKNRIGQLDHKKCPKAFPCWLLIRQLRAYRKTNDNYDISRDYRLFYQVGWVL